jgi:surfeit locus 1 family protein
MKIPDRRSRFWPTLATVVGVAVALSLGSWQLDRAGQKRALKAHFDAQAAQPPIHVGAEELSARDMDLRHAETRGVFEPRYAVFIDNRIHRGVPGYHVVMPLKPEGSDRYVLVNRGWIPRPALRSELPAVRTPSGPVRITGTAVIAAPRTLELSQAVMEGPIWQNLTIERYRKAIPLKVQPFVIRQESALDDGLIRAWDPPDFGIEKHYGYAFQWFALAATLFGFYAVTQFGSRFRRRKPPAA